MADEPKLFRIEYELAELSFREIVVPCLQRIDRFQQGAVRQHVQDGKFENTAGTGPENAVYSYEIPFAETVFVAPYKNLFSRSLDKFRAACRDPRPGPLVDPARGPLRARCISFESTLSAQARNAESVRVDFLDSPELGKEPQNESVLATLAAAVSTAGSLDDQIAFRKNPAEKKPAPFINPLRQINGLARQGLRTQAQVAGYVDEVSASVGSMEDTANVASDPEQIEINKSSRRLRYQLRQSRLIHDPAGVVRDITQTAASTVTGVAAELGMTVQELLVLNPGLRGSPRVPPGTRIKSYSART